MDSFISLLLLLLSFPSALTLTHHFITLGSSLTPEGKGNSSWLSPSGLFAYGFYKQGNGYAVGIFVAGIPEKTVVWTANRGTNPIFPANVSLILSRDGKLLVQQPAQNDTIIYDRDTIASASMLDSGNFILYDAQSKIIWQSFDNPTETLLPGQSLKANQTLVSSVSETDYSEGNFIFIMQGDGNLAQYAVDPSTSSQICYYASNTYGGANRNVTLALRDDGYLILIDSSFNVLQTLSFVRNSIDERVYLLKLDVDGIARLYSFSMDHGDQAILWQSTYDKCAPIGRCGFNSYCTTTDDQMECKCLPGFDFVKHGNWSLGCERNVSLESCKSDANRIVPFEGLWSPWEDNHFSDLQNKSTEECQNACLDDCYCEVAFSRDGQCRMQRLPLRLGGRVSDSGIALIKMGNGTLLSVLGNTNVNPPLVRKEVRLGIPFIWICLGVIGVILLFVTCAVYARIYGGGWYEKRAGFLEGVAPKTFTFEELKQATNNFSHELGRGSFGTVFKGVLTDLEKVVAVKKLEKVLTEGEKEFQNEIRVIGKTHHRNLVRLVGFCLDGAERLLVYEYMSNGSLADILFNKDAHLIPSWDERIEMARDIARGILYLHQECDTQIIHCDIKPQNILMDESRCTKISDFGMAKLLDRDQTRTYTGFRGTRGYVAPEWHRNAAVTVKADVYSFGIVLLEVICCRKSVDFSFPDNEAVLEELSYERFQNGELHTLVPDDQQVERSEFERMIKIAHWCIQYDPSIRPSMNKIVLMLEGSEDIPIPPCPGESYVSAI